LKITYKDILKLLISVVITVWVVWGLVNSEDFDLDNLWSKLQSVEYGWVLLSILISIVSHTLRAYRWTLLLNTEGYRPGVFTTYLAVMIGYLANMAIPRMGEVARCTVLHQEEKIPVSFSLGTVITDRLLDLLMLGLLTAFLLTMQFDLLEGFFVEFIEEKAPRVIELLPYIIAGGILGLIALIYLIRKAKIEENQNSVLYKIASFVTQMISGVSAVTRVKNQALFWLSTFGIWLAYFLMLYVISFGYEPTDDLSLMAGVAVLVMGSLGMATPVNNGIGAYQYFVGQILIVYGIANSDGLVFAIVSHGSQLFSVVIIGILSLLILNFRKRKKNRVTEQPENSQSAGA